MKLNNNTTVNNTVYNPNFKNTALMTPLSKSLYTLGNNDMLNAAAIDVFAMDTPRTAVEFQHRGKQAGIEMGFREFTGTFIAEFSAAVFALGISKLVSKFYKPEIKINSDSWATNNALDTYSDIYNNSKKTPESFVKNTILSMQGLAGTKVNSFADVPEEKTKPIIYGLTKLITDKNLTKKESENLTENIKTQIIDTLGADSNIKVKSGTHEVNSNLSHMLRDVKDLGKNVFFNETLNNSKEILEKLKSMNKSRIMFAIPLSMGLGISNQYINRQLTKRRTGIDNFVGENGYEDNVKNKEEKSEQKGLWLKKLVSAGVFAAMLTKVMGVKKPSDFVNKLEFDGPATGGNAIKTIYGTLVIGRIFASKDSTELRETNVRDYLGFLNWLVFGGFVAKGVGQALDPKQEVLFNISKSGKGISHWLNDISLKNQREIIAQGKDVAKNLKKLNIAQLSGIAYSSVMLGVLLPMLNISMTKNSGNKNSKNSSNEQISMDFLSKYTFDKFENDIKNSQV